MSELRTFHLPDAVVGASTDIELGRRLIETWQADGILQIATDARQDALVSDAYQASRRFFALPQQVKGRYVSDTTYTGYIASGEEVTD